MAVLLTPKFEPTPCVMLVAFSAPMIERLGALVAPLPVLRVEHAPAARERLLVTRPLVILVGSGVPKVDLDALRDAAAGVGAELLELPADGFDDRLMRGWLGQALKIASARRAGRSSVF